MKTPCVPEGLLTLYIKKTSVEKSPQLSKSLVQPTVETKPLCSQDISVEFLSFDCFCALLYIVGQTDGHIADTK